MKSKRRIIRLIGVFALFLTILSAQADGTRVRSLVIQNDGEGFGVRKLLFTQLATPEVGFLSRAVGLRIDSADLPVEELDLQIQYPDIASGEYELTPVPFNQLAACSAARVVTSLKRQELYENFFARGTPDSTATILVACHPDSTGNGLYWLRGKIRFEPKSTGN